MNSFSFRFFSGLVFVFSVSQSAFALTFKDIPMDHMCYDSVSYIAQEQYVSGYSEDQTYRPDNVLTKAQALKIIYAATERELISGGNLSYSDLDENHWAWPYVQSAAVEGVIDWKEGSSFNPEKEVNRAEFSRMAIEGFKIDTNQYSYTRIMTDIPEDAWFATAMNFSVNFGILNVPDGKTKAEPGALMTRCDAAQFIYKMLDRGNGLDAQTLLNLSEFHIFAALNYLKEDNFDEAEQYMDKAALFVDRAAAMFTETPNDTVAGAVRINKAVTHVISARRALKNKEFKNAIEESKNAWSLAQEAINLEPQQESFGKDIQNFAGKTADNARAIAAF
jgi:hypothetical protein